MEGEIVFYEQRDLDDWRPRPHGLIEELHEDTISPLGQLYADWNARNRAAIEEYDTKIANRENYDRRRGI